MPAVVAPLWVRSLAGAAAIVLHQSTDLAENGLALAECFFEVSLAFQNSRDVDVESWKATYHIFDLAELAQRLVQHEQSIIQLAEAVPERCLVLG
jgi:hypothetical protein